MFRRAVIVLACLSLAPIAFAQEGEREQTRQKIAELERQLADLPPGKFDYGLQNELRHLYGGVDQRKSMAHVEIILKHQPLDGYMKQVLGGNDADKSKSVSAMTSVATRYPDLPNLAAACWVWAGDIEPDRARARANFEKALGVKGIDRRFREMIEDRMLLEGSDRKPWPAKFSAPRGMERSPGPWRDPDDPTVWPNTTSRANSDAWLVENQEKIKLMRPRLLLINFSNEHSREHLANLTNQLIRALAESSRYHGNRDRRAPVFLEYQVFKFVDLRDGDRDVGDSRTIPIKDPMAQSGFNMKYRQYFSPEFAAYYGIRDPRNARRFLRLDELLDGGYVHEVWFFTSGNEKVGPHVGAFEVVEEKPRYDNEFRKVARAWVQAGNGGDDEQPWVGRSLRIGAVNASRGPGCFMESLAHGIEGTSNCGAIPYFTKYFKEYADFNLKERYNLPFDNLYAVSGGGQPIRYPNQKTMVVTHDGKDHRVENYIPNGGSAHFPPNARGHYDLENASPVLTTIEDWRIGSGPGGKDLAKPFTNQTFRRYQDIAPDCMGQWLVYWRQNMPGRGNRQKDDDGKPMKNWWPFLFY
jgi:hypothetical protein